MVAQITFDAATGMYLVEYIGLGDTTHFTTLVPGNRAIPHVSASVTVDSEGRFRYEYELRNDRMSLAGLRTFDLPVHHPHSITVPQDSGWTSLYIPGYDGLTWYQSGHIDNDIAPGSSLSGFRFTDVYPPRIVTADGASMHYLAFDDEGPGGPIGAALDSLDEMTIANKVATVAPWDTLSPTFLGEFIDTLATYPSRAEDLGWIDSTTTVADDLQSALDELSNYVSDGESARALAVIERTLELVEAEKNMGLTSEAYALFKYNLEYAQRMLIKTPPGE